MLQIKINVNVYYNIHNVTIKGDVIMFEIIKSLFDEEYWNPSKEINPYELRKDEWDYFLRLLDEEIQKDLDASNKMG